MPVLHFRLDHTTQVETGTAAWKHQINLDTDIHAQNFTFKRAIVTYKQDEVVPTGNPPIGVIIDCGNAFFQGPEVISNFSSNDLMIPIANGDNIIPYALPGLAPLCTADVRYDQDFSAQDIKRGFTVVVRDWFDNQTCVALFDPATALSGEIQTIDLFFAFDQLDDPDIY